MWPRSRRSPRWRSSPKALVYPQVAVIGASGGVAAVVGACVVLQPRAQVAAGLGPLVLRVGIVAFAIFWAAFQLLMALLHIPGTAWVAHLAGLALGVAGAYVLRRRQRRQLSPNQLSRS